jgi:hypothetical protein
MANTQQMSMILLRFPLFLRAKATRRVRSSAGVTSEIRTLDSESPDSPEIAMSYAIRESTPWYNGFVLTIIGMLCFGALCYIWGLEAAS